jgi:hypothetical protein
MQNKILKLGPHIYFKTKDVDNVVAINSESPDFDLYEFAQQDVPLFNLLKDGTTFDELLEWMMEEYEATEETMRRDLNEFLTELIDLNLVQVLEKEEGSASPSL